ncbi:MAG TPA: helix-turn-helix domain-containing protein [Ramlibacter sp.]
MTNAATLDRTVHRLHQETSRCAAPATRRCATCRVSTLCLPGGLSEDDLQPLDSLLLTTRRVAAGQSIFAEGDPFRFIYAVRSGTCKTAMLRSDGREQVTGFHMAGEVMGLEGLAHGTHRITATALEDGEVCLIPYERLVAATVATPGAKDLVRHLMGQEMERDHGVMVVLGLTDAGERLAAFLLNLSERHASRGWSPREFHLRMSRGDIASFLGVKLETISRTFSSFQKRGFLEVSGRHVRITDLEGLKSGYGLRLR